MAQLEPFTRFLAFFRHEASLVKHSATKISEN